MACLLTNSAMIQHAEQLVKDHMKHYDPSHDWYHVDRVRRTALKIAGSLEPQPDMTVVELAALFHDMAAKYGPTTSLGSILSPFFSIQNLPLTPSQCDLILEMIPLVSWSTEKRMRSEGTWDVELVEKNGELRAVQDADRLDAIGAFGIMRCAAYSAATNRPLFVPPTSESADHLALINNSAIQHFHDKLLHIRDRIKTPLGKEMAERRHQAMLSFLQSVDEEYAH